jgi:hypothetical protein
VTLRRAGLPQHTRGPAFGDAEPLAHIHNGLRAGLRSFPWRLP